MLCQHISNSCFLPRWWMRFWMRWMDISFKISFIIEWKSAEFSFSVFVNKKAALKTSFLSNSQIWMLKREFNRKENFYTFKQTKSPEASCNQHRILMCLAMKCKKKNTFYMEFFVRTVQCWINMLDLFYQAFSHFVFFLFWNLFWDLICIGSRNDSQQI